jgi:regulator of replication initiation timing
MKLMQEIGAARQRFADLEAENAARLAERDRLREALVEAAIPLEVIEQDIANAITAIRAAILDTRDREAGQ